MQNSDFYHLCPDRHFIHREYASLTGDTEPGKSLLFKLVMSYIQYQIQILFLIIVN